MNTQYWYYPLTFQSYVFYANCRAIRSGASGDGWSWYPVAPTLSYARFLEKDENAYCLSVGYQQWGRSTNNSGHTDTFPVSFGSNCYSITFCNDQGVHYNVNCSISSFTKSSVTWYTNCNGHYITIGYQQWGTKSETTAGGASEQTQTLPIAFTNTSYQVSRCINNTAAGNSSIHDNGFGTLSKTNTTYKYRYPNIHTGWSHQWIAIGIQQWGECIGSNYGTSIKFPLSFKSTKFLQMATPYTTGGFWQAPMTVWLDAELTAIYAGAYGGSDYLKAAYIAIGIQQWGRSVNANTTFTYPLALSLVLGVAGMSIESDWSFVTDITTTKLYNNTDCKASLFVIGKAQQWGICNTKRSSDLMECAFPASNPKETLAIFATYFDDSNVYNGAILVKSTILSSCIMNFGHQLKFVL